MNGIKGINPIVFFVMEIPPNSEAFVYSSIFTGAAFFLVGIIKGKIVQRSIIKSGIYTLIIGGIAAGVAYGVGYLLKQLVM